MNPSEKMESISRRLLEGGKREERSSDLDTYMDFYQRVYMPYYQNYHHNYLSYPYPLHPAAAEPIPSLPTVRYPYPNPWMLQYPSPPAVEIGSMSGGTSSTMENKNCNDKKMPASEDEDVNSDEVDVMEVGKGDGIPLLPPSYHHPAVMLPPPMIMRKPTIAPITKITPNPATSPVSLSSSNDELKD